MDPITAKLMSAAGAAADSVYVDDVFSIDIFDGNGSSQTITNGIDLAGEGGMVWGKTRTTSVAHTITDTERGVNKELFTNTSDGEVVRSTGTGSVTAFNSNGFTTSAINGFINYSGHNACSWTFRKCPGFFDVVTWTGNGTSGRTISHNLGSVPGSIWVKRLSSSDNWWVYHRSTGNTKYLYLNSNIAGYTGSEAWNNTTPTASVFTVGNDTAVNANGQTYVAYIFAHDDQSFGGDGDEAIIKCGSYSGTGSAGHEIDLGFEAQWVMVKRISGGTGNWEIADIMRGQPVSTGSTDGNFLRANSSNAESTNYPIHPNPTGFTIQNFGGGTNASGSTYIYIAIRRPHKPPEAGTDVFALDTQNSGSYSSPPYYRSNFVVDTAWRAYLPDVSTRIASRITGEQFMVSSSVSAESTNNLFEWDYMNGYGGSNVSGATTDVMTYMFKRAPGFFDVVCYEGTSNTSNNVNHNLGVVPNMMILKKRDGTSDWAVRTVDSAASGGDLDRTGFQLNSDGPVSNTGFLHAGLTATTFNPYYISTRDSNGNGTYGDNALNTSGSKYIAYLFAELEGISKIGAYTGTGNDLDIDCGFTNGARFVLIKRTSGATDWWVLDTLRGINAGNDPAFGLNQGSTNTSSYDLVDPYSSGFTAVGGTAAINISGEKYIFLAIA